jgi:outer membrane protein assembly factor BamA
MTLAFALMVLVLGNPGCAQPAAEQNKLMEEAQRNEFTLRRVEFVGLTYTRDHVLRERMTPVINEGDVFTRAKLVTSLRRMSELKRVIYPLRLTNVIVQLDRSQGGFVDLIVCFRERPRR